MSRHVWIWIAIALLAFWIGFFVPLLLEAKG